MQTLYPIAVGTVCCVLIVGLIVAIILASSRKPDSTANDVNAENKPQVSSVEHRGSNPEATKALPQPLSAAQVFERMSGSVASLKAMDEFGKPVAQGSGFVVSTTGGARDPKATRALGLILTNYHVIEAAADLEIEFPGGHQFRTMDVISESERDDLAIIQFRSETLTEPPEGVAEPLVVSSAIVAVGSRVFAIGAPQGLANSLSEGLVSGHRSLRDELTLIQTSTPVSGGSSGCPLISEFGEVVGIVTASHKEGQNLNFAVSSLNACELLRAAATRSKAGRDIWRGRSIKDEWQSACFKVKIDSDRQRRDAGSPNDSHEQAIDRFFSAILREEEADAARAIQDFENQAAERLEWLRQFLLGIAALKRHSIDRLPETASVGRRGWLLDDGNYVGGGALTRGVNVERATDHFQSCVEKNRDFAPGLFYWALTQAATDKVHEALATITELTVQMPNCGRVWHVRGAIFSFLSQQPAARRDLERAHELMPSNADVCDELGMTCRFLKDFDAALSWHNKAMALDDQPYSKGMHQMRLAEVYHDMGATEKATAMLIEARKSGLPETIFNEFNEKWNRESTNAR